MQQSLPGLAGLMWDNQLLGTAEPWHSCWGREFPEEPTGVRQRADPFDCRA